MTSARSSSLRPASLPGSSPRRTSLAIVCKQGIPLLYVGLRRVHAGSEPHVRHLTPEKHHLADEIVAVGRRATAAPAVLCPIQRRTVTDTAPHGARCSAARCPRQRRTVPQISQLCERCLPNGCPFMCRSLGSLTCLRRRAACVGVGELRSQLAVDVDGRGAVHG